MNALILYGIIALVGLAALGGITYKIHHAGYESGMVECATKAQKQREAEAKQSEGASTKLESGNAKARVVYRTITQNVDRYIERPIYRNECFDAAGMLDANSALRGTLSVAGKLDRTVPGSDAARDGDRGGGPAKAD